MAACSEKLVGLSYSRNLGTVLNGICKLSGVTKVCPRSSRSLRYLISQFPVCKKQKLLISLQVCNKTVSIASYVATALRK